MNTTEELKVNNYFKMGKFLLIFLKATFKTFFQSVQQHHFRFIFFGVFFVYFFTHLETIPSYTGWIYDGWTWWFWRSFPTLMILWSYHTAKRSRNHFILQKKSEELSICHLKNPGTVCSEISEFTWCVEF